MKKVFLAMLLILPIVFQSCSDDDDDSLIGTVWVCYEPLGMLNYETHLTFVDESRVVTSYYENGEKSEETEEATYVVSGSNIVFTYDDGSTYSGTIKGNTMTMVYDKEPDFPFVFKKR